MAAVRFGLLMGIIIIVLTTLCVLLLGLGSTRHSPS